MPPAIFSETLSRASHTVSHTAPHSPISVLTLVAALSVFRALLPHGYYRWVAAAANYQTAEKMEEYETQRASELEACAQSYLSVQAAYKAKQEAYAPRGH